MTTQTPTTRQAPRTYGNWRRPSTAGFMGLGQIGTGVVYYLKSGQVRGVLLWNVWDSVDKARELIAETTNRRAMDRALSTSLNGTPVAARRTRRPSRGTTGVSTGRASAD